jgi:hypothetical protein
VGRAEASTILSVNFRSYEVSYRAAEQCLFIAEKAMQKGQSLSWAGLQWSRDLTVKGREEPELLWQNRRKEQERITRSAEQDDGTTDWRLTS